MHALGRLSKNALSLCIVQGTTITVHGFPSFKLDLFDIQNPERGSGGSGKADRQKRGPPGHADAERQEARRDPDPPGSLAPEPGRKTEGPGIRRRILSGGLYLSSFKSC